MNLTAIQTQKRIENKLGTKSLQEIIYIRNHLYEDKDTLGNDETFSPGAKFNHSWEQPGNTHKFRLNLRKSSRKGKKMTKK